MGFFDSIKEALGGEREEPTDEATPRHVNRDAPEESQYGPQTTGGKHRLGGWGGRAAAFTQPPPET